MNIARGKRVRGIIMTAALAAGLASGLMVATTAPAQAAALTDLTEGFADVSALTSNGWFLQNLSSPAGPNPWMQGASSNFPAHTGSPNDFASANYRSTTGVGTISNWMLTPELALTNGSQLTFWTRTITASASPDRLQVRLSTSGDSKYVGTAATEVGAFTTVLEDINPTLIVGGFPQVWTRYAVRITGLPAPTTGRIGFRYFVTDGGTGPNSNYIGVDTVSYAAAPSVQSVSPDHGHADGGTAVTITGTGFASGATATIGGAACTSPAVATPTTLTCTTGPHPAGTVTATVTNPGGLSGTGGSFGYGRPGPLMLTPDPLSFGSVAVGTAPAPRAVTVTNTGTEPVTPSAITAGPAPLAIASPGPGDCQSGSPIPPSGTCTVPVTWIPLAAGPLAGGITVAYPGGSSASNSATVTGLATATLAAPTGLKVKAKARKVTATWSAVAGATGYTANLSGKRRPHQHAKGKRVTRSAATDGARATFKIALRPGSTARVCVMATSTGGKSPTACRNARVRG